MPGRAVRAHDASVFMRPRLDSRGGTFTDAGMPSEDVLLEHHVPSSGSCLSAGPVPGLVAVAGMEP